MIPFRVGLVLNGDFQPHPFSSCPPQPPLVGKHAAGQLSFHVDPAFNLRPRTHLGMTPHRTRFRKRGERVSTSCGPPAGHGNPFFPVFAEIQQSMHDLVPLRYSLGGRAIHNPVTSVPPPLPSETAKPPPPTTSAMGPNASPTLFGA